MTDTSVYFSHESGEPQYDIDLQSLIHCLGDSGQAGLIKIEGFENPHIKSYLPGSIYKKACEKFHALLFDLQSNGILRKEDIIFFHNKKYNNAIIFLSKKRDTNYYLMQEMDLLLYRLYDTLFTEMAKDFRIFLPWQETFHVTGSFLLFDPQQPLGEFISKSINDANENLKYFQKKYYLRKKEIINHVIIHKEIKPQYFNVIDLKTNSTAYTYGISRFKSEIPWMKNPWTAFMVASEVGFEIELDEMSHQTIMAEHTKDKSTPIVLIFTNPWAQLQKDRSFFLQKLENLNASFPQKKILSLPIASKSDVQELLNDLELRNIYPELILSIDLFTDSYEIESSTLPQVKVIEIKRDLFRFAIENNTTRKVLDRVTSISKENDCQVLINGIENQGELEIAKELNANLGVGYYLQGMNTL
ncbi:MAG: hypothetical protein COA79_04815 [Planctomycetota bacterium]|nr:MAG: hypothetical protein COA79_04815 [Planctomycetota bacterium]